MIEAPERTKTSEQPAVVLLQQAIAWFRAGDMQKADELFCQVLALDPGQHHALHLLGLVAEKRGDFGMAEDLIARSIAIHPQSRAYANLGVIQQHRARYDAALASYRACLAREPDYLPTWTNLLFALDLHPYGTWQIQQAERRRFNDLLCAPLTNAAAPHTNDRSPDRQLRVGYVSADFKHHSAASTFKFVTRHTPDVAVYLYSLAETHDDMTEPFKDRADVWCEVAALDDAEIAAVIREDQIDILVDLAAYTRGGRPLVTARKPAPIIVTGWGYAQGMGIDGVDYLVADQTVVPDGHRERYHEKPLYLPSLFSYDPGTYPEIVDPPQVRNGYRTYGYAGRAVKLNDRSVALWAEVLRADPTGHLLLKGVDFADKSMRERVTDILVGLGVEPARIEVDPRLTSRYEHLQTYNRTDVALDTYPQGGGVTAADSLLMGVPMVCLSGETIAGRIGASFLTTLGYGEWIAQDETAYARAATQNPLPDRQRLRDALLGSPICDLSGYAAQVERAYRQAWKAWCAA